MVSSPNHATFQNVKVEKVSESGDMAEVKIVSGKIIMDAAGQKDEQDLATAGITGSSANPKLQKIDGTWYIIP